MAVGMTSEGSAQVDRVVGVDRGLPSSARPEGLVGRAGDHLIGVHVGTGAAAGLEDVERKVRVVGTSFHRPGRRAGWRLRPRARAGPSARLAAAAAPLIIPSARMNVRGNLRPLTGKFCTARCVWAPYSASAGTCTGPMLSRSTRNASADMAWSFASKTAAAGCRCGSVPPARPRRHPRCMIATPSASHHESVVNGHRGSRPQSASAEWCHTSPRCRVTLTASRQEQLTLMPSRARSSVRRSE